jgi:excisionase family DNA binding protein
MAHIESQHRMIGEGRVREGALSCAPEILTVREVGRILRIGRNQAYGLVKSGRLRSCRIGGIIRVPRVALEQFLAGAPSEEGPGRA